MAEPAQKQYAKCRAYAKVNLSLNISGTRGGYHLIDSVAASVDLFDEVVARPRRDTLVNVYMRGMGSESIPPEENNAVRAGEAFVSALGTCGADIQIRKNIPLGAGLGGSSADAAGVLNAMAKLYGADGEELVPLAAACGSDTPYMLGGGFARLSGRGERVERLPLRRTFHMLLLLPEGGTSAAACYKKYDEAPDPLRADSARLWAALAHGGFADVCENVYNALGAPACALHAGTAEALALARSLSPAACAVTGSGSGVFALFETEEVCRWAQGHCKNKKKLRTLVVRTLQPRGTGG